MKNQNQKKKEARLLVRQFPCAICNHEVLLYPDGVNSALRCNCGIVKTDMQKVNLELFEVILQ